MPTLSSGRSHRTLVIAGLAALAAACGDQSLGGFHDTAPDGGGGPDSGVGAADAGKGFGPLDGAIDNTPCGSSANPTAQGCEFYSVAPWAWTSGACFAAMLVNPGTTPVTIQVEY